MTSAAGSSLRATALASVVLGLVLGLAHWVWLDVEDSGLGSPCLEAVHMVQFALTLLAWATVVLIGVLALATTRPPARPLAGGAAACAVLAGVLALVLLLMTAFGTGGSDAFDAVLLQSWPLLVLLLLVGDWVRRSRFMASTPA